MTELPIPDQVTTIVDKWYKRYIREEMKSSLAFPNRNKHKFDWENDKLDDNESLVEYAYPEILVQIPVIDLETEQDIDRDLIKIIFSSE